MINFKQNFYEESYSLCLAEEDQKLAIEKKIPTSDKVAGIEVRLSNVFIIDNHTGHFGPFPGNANLYLINIMISEQQEKPIIQEVSAFEKINDNESLSIDKTIYITGNKVLTTKFRHLRSI